MPAPYETEVPFSFGGLTLNVDPIRSDPNKASYVRNIRKLASGAISEREGHKVTMANDITGAFGTFLYLKTNPSTMIETTEQLVVGANLYKKTCYDLTITYGSPASVAVGECLFDAVAEEWVFKLYENGTVVLSQGLGIGFDETTPYPISDLVTAINATPGFVATVNAAANALPAALLKSTPPTAFSPSGPSSVFTIEICSRVQVNQPTGASDPFAGTSAAKNASNFENVSAFQTSGSIYFCSKYDEQKKYDGNDCYRSGAPTTTISSATSVGSGASPTAGVRKYIATIVQVDQNDMEVEGNESAEVSVTTVGTHNIDVVVQNVLNTTGFNTDCAVVNGAGQANVNTITVDNGSGGNHTMKVGQRAYFYDAVTGDYIVRRISTVAATTITVEGAAVTVADNAVISNNLRVRLRRTQAAGSLFYFLIDLPNNSFAATQTYRDAIADTALGEIFTSPASLGIDHGLPPRAAYGTIFNSRPVVACLSGDPSGFAWASPEGPEYYPENFTDFISGTSNAPITGCIGSDRYLWIGQNYESFLITGDLFRAQYTISKKGDRVGFLSHSSIVDTDIGIIWLGDGGFYYSADGAIPVRISGDIEQVFINSPRNAEQALVFKRAVSVWDSKNKLYICFIPAESLDSSNNTYANSFSRIFVYDAREGLNGQARAEWYEWDSWNMLGGAAYDEATEAVFWTERRYSEFENDVTFHTRERLSSNTIYDAIDHGSAIKWEYRQNWYHAGKPKVNKKFPTVALFAMDPEAFPNCTITISTERNFVEGLPHTEITQVFGAGGSSSGWGYGSWGFFPWGSPINAGVKTRRLKNGPCESIRFIFEGGEIYSRFVLSNFQLLTVAPYRIDMKEARNTNV